MKWKKPDWDEIINKKVWVLIDPEKYNPEIISNINQGCVGAVLVGGSGIRDKTQLKKVIRNIKKRSQVPVILFPSEAKDVCRADGILFTSLLSGNKIRYIIGEQILAAAKVRKYNLSYLSVAYLLVGTGRTAVSKVSGTKPIPFSQSRKILDTCLAANLLGFRSVYLEAGSGAKQAVPQKLVKKICLSISIPVIVGGGIRNIKEIKSYFKSGASVVVIGNHLERNPEFMEELKKLNS